jgi:hypothetical protein
VITDPNLAEVVQAWPDLPEAIKAGIVALVKASVPSQERREIAVIAETPRRPREGGGRWPRHDTAAIGAAG